MSLTTFQPRDEKEILEWELKSREIKNILNNSMTLADVLSRTPKLSI